MEKKLPGFIQMTGSYVKAEPTFRNEIEGDETIFKNIFQAIGHGIPYIEVYIYPLPIGGTSIQISEHWLSMGVPSWLIWL
jgi:hypothetical protein